MSEEKIILCGGARNAGKSWINEIASLDISKEELETLRNMSISEFMKRYVAKKVEEASAIREQTIKLFMADK